MRFLVLQHSAVDDPGRFRELFDARGIDWDAVEVQNGEPIPPVQDYDALWVLGGPMDVWEEDARPWLVAEKQAIRDAVQSHGMPYLGICLGHQLLADALGGVVRRMEKPEIGVLEIHVLAGAEGDPLFRGSASRFPSLQWHGAQVTKVPPGAVALARSRETAVQALRWGGIAWGLQFHCEVGADTVSSWCSLPDYRAELEKGLGPGAGQRLALDVDRELDLMAAWSERLFDHFVAQVDARARIG